MIIWRSASPAGSSPRRSPRRCPRRSGTTRTSDESLPQYNPCPGFAAAVPVDAGRPGAGVLPLGDEHLVPARGVLRPLLDAGVHAVRLDPGDDGAGRDRAAGPDEGRPAAVARG